MIKGVAAFALVHAIMSLVFAFSPKHNPYILNGIIPMKKTKFMALCLTLALLALVLMNVLGGNGSPAYYDSGYPIYY